MYFLTSTCLSLLAFCVAQASVLPAKEEREPNDELPIRLLYEFPKDTWIENIGVRASGELLITRFDQPLLEQFNPFEDNSKPTVVHSFDESLAVMGIAEIAPDSFAVIVGNASLTEGATPGSWSVWNVNFEASGGISAEVKEIAAIPDVEFADGMCSLPSSGPMDNLLVGDIEAGAVYFVDTTTGDSRLAIKNTLTAARTDPLFGSSGVNGLHVKDAVLYFTNSAQRLFASNPIHPNGTPAGESHAITRVHKPEQVFYYDDFAIKGEDAYLVTGSDNAIEKIGLDGTSKGRIVAGNLNSTQIAGPTSAALGRTPEDEHILYVVTSGALAAPVDGDITIGAQIVAVDTRGWGC